MSKLFIFCILVSSINSFGQKISFGIDLGISKNSRNMHSAISNERSSGINPLLAAQAGIESGSWQGGLKAALVTLETRIIGAGDEGYGNNFIANPAIVPSIFANRLFHFNRLTAYAGLNAGYLINKHSFTYWDAQRAVNINERVNGNGFTAGTQVGLLVRLNKHFSVGSELGLNYFSAKQPEYNKTVSHYHLLEGSAVVTLRYGL